MQNNQVSEQGLPGCVVGFLSWECLLLPSFLPLGTIREAAWGGEHGNVDLCVLTPPGLPFCASLSLSLSLSLFPLPLYCSYPLF
jgi:hypothetical protein